MPVPLQIPRRMRACCPWVGGVLAAYLLVFAMLPHRGFFINDNGTKFIQMEALIRSGYRQVSIPWPGSTGNRSYRFNPLPAPFGRIHDGRLYGFYSDTFAALSSLPYRVAGFDGLYAIPLVSGALLLAATWGLAGFLPRARIGQPLAVVIAGLCTPIWFYSLTFWEHVPAVCLSTGSVVAMLRHRRSGRPGPLAASAILCGLAIYFRDELYLWAVCLAGVFLLADARCWRRATRFAGVLALTLLPLWSFQWLESGSPLGGRLASVAPLGFAGNGFEAFLYGKLHAAGVLLLNAHRQPLWSALATIPFVLLLVLRPRVPACRLDTAVRSAAALAVLCSVVVLGGLLGAERPLRWLMHANGLFAAAPVLVFGLLRPLAAERDAASGSGAETARARTLLGVLVLAYAVIYVLVTPPQNTRGVHWGCRLLLPLYPVLAVLAASTLAEWFASRSRATGALVLASILASFGAQIYSLRLLHDRKAHTARLNREVAARPESVVAAVGWYLAQDLAPNFYSKTIYLVRRERGLSALLDYLRATGANDVLVVSNRALGLPLRDPVRLDDGLGRVPLEIGALTLGRDGG